MFDRRTLVKIAHWYYEQGMTQAEIAHRLQCSRQHVNRIVNSLVDEGIVVITINGFDDNLAGLELALEEHYGLKQVVLAESDDVFDNRKLGRRAADFLDGYIQNGNVIGVSWGFTLSETITNMRPVNKSGCRVIQLVGGLNTEHRMVRPDEITRMLADRLHCDYHLMYAPAIVDNVVVLQLMTNNEPLRELLGDLNRCDIAVVGIGELTRSSTSYEQGYFSEDLLKKMDGDGYIGDVCLNPYRIDGSWADYANRNQILGVNIANLQSIPNVIAVAGGPDKVNAIQGALHIGCIDVLITDVNTAKQLAKQEGLIFKQNQWQHSELFRNA